MASLRHAKLAIVVAITTRCHSHLRALTSRLDVVIGKEIEQLFIRFSSAPDGIRLLLLRNNHWLTVLRVHKRKKIIYI